MNAPVGGDVVARRAALDAVGPERRSELPGVAYESRGRVLILGPEHRIRQAAARLENDLAVCGLVTEALPERITDEIEAAAALAPSVPVLFAALRSLDGHLGRFEATIDVDGTPRSLAEMVFRQPTCDLVLDLGTPPRIARELDPPGYFRPDSPAALEQALAALKALTGEFEKPRYVQIDTALCAHSASGLTGCTRCLDACPADAIRSVAHAIRIDAHLCQGAGGCATACPTGAIRYSQPEPAGLHQRLGQLLRAYREADGRSPRVLVHDAESGAEWVGANIDALPGCWLPLQVEEIGAAGLDLWLQALAQGAAEVVLLIAGEMPDSIRRDLARELEIAGRILDALGRGRPVRCVGTDEFPFDAPTPEARPAMRAPGGAYRKRELISEATAHLYRHSGLPVADQPVALPAGAPFGTLRFAEAGCTLCMSCVSSCPARALGSTRDLPRLSFIEDRCVQCGLCVQACPEKVLALEPRYQLDPELRAAPRILKEERPFECIRCGKPFATHSMIRTMQAKLAGHPMFAGAALERLKMCANCRVIDQALNDPASGLLGLGGDNDGARTGTVAARQEGRH